MLRKLDPFLLFVFVAVAFVLSFWSLTIAPSNFPVNQPIEIEPGLSAKAVTKDLKQLGLIKSELIFGSILIVLNEQTNIKASTYVFNSPISSFHLAKVVTDVAPPESLVSLTFPEGFSNAEFAKIASDTLRDFDSETFLELTEEQEGFLFPDTYLVPADYQAEELAHLLYTTFQQKTEPINEKLQSHRLTKDGLIILASIVEREANTIESMKTVAGIFDTRLNLGMPLQADASLEYVLNKPLNELTAADLEIDSPYNTYLHKGLTPTPIGNPGLDSIMAVLEPIYTDYLFYLTDKDGNFHYAETYQDHQRNIEQFLR